MHELVDPQLAGRLNRIAGELFDDDAYETADQKLFALAVQAVGAYAQACKPYTCPDVTREVDCALEAIRENLIPESVEDRDGYGRLLRYVGYLT